MVFVASLVILGKGFTVIVKVCEVPIQLVDPLLRVGTTVMVAISGEEVVLVTTKAGISPDPLAPRPIPVWLFDHV